MQAQIAAMLETQNQMQVQLQTPPLAPVQPPPIVPAQVVVQQKERDPNVLYEQIRKRGATEFHGTEGVIQADEWLEHIENVFEMITCTVRQKVLLASSVLRGVANVWWKSVKDALLAIPEAEMWEAFKRQFERKFVPEHVQQNKESEFMHPKQGQMSVSAYVHTFLQLAKYAPDLVDTEEKKVKRFLNDLNPFVQEDGGGIE